MVFEPFKSFSIHIATKKLYDKFWCSIKNTHRYIHNDLKDY